MEQGYDDVIKLREGSLVWRQVGDEVVVLDTTTSQYLSVNRTGSTLWPLLLEGCRRPDLVRTLVDHFQVDAAIAERDVDDFLSSLVQLAALE